MTRRSRLSGIRVALALLSSATGLLASSSEHPITDDEVLAWRRIVSPVLSRDGRWLAYRLVPNDGEADIVFRHTTSQRELRVPIARITPRATVPAIQIAADARWAAFTVHPSAAAILDLATGDVTSFRDIERFDISSTEPIVALGQKASGNLFLYRPETKDTSTIGHVVDWAFAPDGGRIAWSIAAAGATGSGVHVFDVRRRTLSTLASGETVYRRLAWSPDGSRLAAIAHDGPDDRPSSLVVFDRLGDDAVVIKAASAVSGTRQPQWRADGETVVFGAIRPTPAHAGTTVDGDRVDLAVWHWQDIRLPPQIKVEQARDQQASDLAIYHVRDHEAIRLSDETLQQVLLPPRGRWAVGLDARAYARHAHITSETFHDVYAIDLESGSRRLAVTKLLTSDAAAERRFLYPAPDGRHLLFWREGHFWVRELDTGETRNLTAHLPTSFVDTDDDHARNRPPVDPQGFYRGVVSRWGWSADACSVVLCDGWDLWRVPIDGGVAVNLTRDGRRRGIRYWRRAWVPEGEHGIDLAQPLLVATLDERTKAQTLVRVAPDGSGVTPLLTQPGRVLPDTPIALPVLKAAAADVYAFARESCVEPADYYVTTAQFASPRRVTNVGTQRDGIAWSPGARLIEYATADGTRLNGALYLPAGYVPGRRYPLIVQVYERWADRYDEFSPPEPSLGINLTVYTSRGYAVLRPDIATVVNDPGRSAVRSVTAAVKAAMATGVVDPSRIGLYGHSYGGFEAAFLITQTDIFAAAAASAAATNLVSFYNGMYWNTGKPNSSIFEHDQLRFDGPYPDRLVDAFIRNSAVFHASTVKTPLLLLSNDKDGAVDWHQGIEYFNILRRLGKPVIMLQYSGEGHLLTKPANLRDFSRRLQAFFDHHLKGTPAPDWMARGTDVVAELR